MTKTVEILAALDAMDASVNSFRKLNEWDTSKSARKWSVALKAEKSGVAIEVKPQFGETFDDALAAAWAKFEPAVQGGIPQLAISDASFDVVSEESPF